MGDRCYMSLMLFGELNEVEDAERLVNFFEKSSRGGYTFSPLPQSGSVVRELLTKCGNPEFVDDQCNYASYDEHAELLRDIGLGYLAHNQPGDDYGEEAVCYYPSEASAYSVAMLYGAPVLWAKEVERTGRLQAYLDNANKAFPTVLPPFTMSDEVREYLLAKV